MQEHQFTHWLDALSIGTVVATLAGWLPSMAALASMIWTCIRIVETRTVQNWMKKLKENKSLRAGFTLNPSSAENCPYANPAR